jgi:hypothetical protein
MLTTDSFTFKANDTIDSNTATVSIATQHPDKDLFGMINKIVKSIDEARRYY